MDSVSSRRAKDRDLSSLGIALLASDSAVAVGAEKKLRQRYDWAEVGDASTIVALGGDGFMLQTLHRMIDEGPVRPVFGMNRGTVGFLMNEYRLDDLAGRIERAKAVRVSPLAMVAKTVEGETHRFPAFNEVSLLRETRQTAKIEIGVDGRVVMPELVADGILVATPAGSTAYNLSAHGPILPLSARNLALTPISPFRPRRWSGAILPDEVKVKLRVLEAAKRPVSAVADQHEVRGVKSVEIALDRSIELTLLFDPEHALDERIAMEQFAT